MACKVGLSTLLVIAFVMISSATAMRLGESTHHGCNKACPINPADTPKSAPAPHMGMVDGAVHHVEEALHHAKEALHLDEATDPEAWDSKHKFCTSGSLVAADLGAEEEDILHHLKGVLHLKKGQLKLEADETEEFVHESAKFHIHNREAKENDVHSKRLKDAFDEIKNACCSSKESEVCLGGWYESDSLLNADSFFVRIAPAGLAAA
ncbi:unnamed protein product [Calypogeia fissa]